MEALKFLQETHRMCGMRENCDNCPVKDIYCDMTKEKYDFAKFVEIVEKWSSEHPVKTRQSELLKMFPNAATFSYGTYSICDICPAKVDETIECDIGREDGCYDCKRKYWLTEVE